ncbi:MAG: hypothetical protein L0Z62_04520 [Gemmataceae bacterium]|nr:hypothetical protein [Gemmataceae bacterium]
MRTYGLAVLAGLALAAPAAAQGAPWRFRWQPKQILTYRVEHTSTAAETVGGTKTESTSKVQLTKRWQVLEVDAQGTATLQLSLTALRHEQTRPGGGVLLFDSANPDKSTPELREQMAKYVGQPIAVVRVDAYGRVVEVKQGPKERFESELPFQLMLPAAVPAPGQAWARTYKIALDSAEGKSEQADVTQRYTCAKIEASGAHLTVKTEFSKLPEGAQERLPLLQKMPEGEVVFDVANGRLQSAQLRIDQTVQGHQGEGSRYRFQSSYSEQFAGQ